MSHDNGAAAADDSVPRDVIALVVLHAPLSNRTPGAPFVGDAMHAYTDVAYDFADAMCERSQELTK
jgi:hypothetical protein